MLDLREKLKVWNDLPQDTPEQQLWADNYYADEILPRAQENFCGHYGTKNYPRYYGMFLLLGDHWEWSVFTPALMHPANIHVICNREASSQIRYIQENLQLDDDAVVWTEVKDQDTAALYRVMKKQHDIWDSMGRCAIDITGRSRVMGAAAAMAAERMNIDIYDIRAARNANWGRLQPGTETLIRIPSVTSVLGDIF